ncbi:MAG: hypothetical protein LBQ47_02955 [Endomicrobium sp.]|nr:hypothetical protein [Endomicrobium sp.]
MKNLFKTALFMSFAAFMSAAVIGCGENYKDKTGFNSIIGTWEQSLGNSTHQIEFKSSGEYISYVFDSEGKKLYARKGTFTYTSSSITTYNEYAWFEDEDDLNDNDFPDDNEFFADYEETTVTYSLSGNHLTFYDEDGETVLTRK